MLLLAGHLCQPDTSTEDGAGLIRSCKLALKLALKIALELRSRNLEQLGAKIGILAIVVCVLVFVIGVVLDRRDSDNPTTSAALYMVLIAVTLAVAAIPEGIPLCVTISLSIGCSDMVNQHVLVRKLAAVETLGSASVICSDKTGTLTEGKMTMAPRR